MIAVIDCGSGNIGSVQNALNFLGYKNELVSGSQGLEKAGKIILPGVGNFGAVAARLGEKGLDKAILREIRKGKPFLGICLGFQLLFEGSDESPGAKGFGLLEGRCEKFSAKKVPQIGWNKLTQLKGKLFEGVEEGSYAYFINSYCVKQTKNASAKAYYFEEFASAVEKGNIFGVQFHPERSGLVGLKILGNFCKVKPC